MTRQRIAHLRALVKEGIDDLDRGRYVELTTDDLEAQLERLFAEKSPSFGKRRVPIPEIKKKT
ncbi:MAG: hypothetical protein ING44_00330 [Telmatospirillum sp.]|nr:hypothetical protein [Telmatospirillum sp.]